MAVVVFEHSPTCGVMRLGSTLRDYGHRLRVIRLDEGEPVPADLDDVDAVVATGGRHSALDPHAWLEPEMDFLRRADAAALPVVGICLGSQILARALGGEVGPVEGGIELGWQDVTLSPAGCEDPLHAGIAWTSKQFEWHRDQVTTPPPGARVLASSERSPNQTWARGLRTYGFQYHPEILPATPTRWAADKPDDLAEAGVSEGLIREATQQHYPAFERLTERLFESMALYLLPADRRNRGLVKDLHH